MAIRIEVNIYERLSMPGVLFNSLSALSNPVWDVLLIHSVNNHWVTTEYQAVFRAPPGYSRNNANKVPALMKLAFQGKKTE